jgi:hypothetical protein
MPNITELETKKLVIQFDSAIVSVRADEADENIALARVATTPHSVTEIDFDSKAVVIPIEEIDETLKAIERLRDWLQVKISKRRTAEAKKMGAWTCYEPIAQVGNDNADQVPPPGYAPPTDSLTDRVVNSIRRHRQEILDEEGDLPWDHGGELHPNDRDEHGS